MQPEQHLAASRTFLNDAAALESQGSHMGAAEMIWGATVQALEALEHIRTGIATGSLSSRRRRRLAESITRDGLFKYYMIQNDLHGYFYKGHLSMEVLTDRMRQGRDYATELLTLALSPEPGGI